MAVEKKCSHQWLMTSEEEALVPACSAGVDAGDRPQIYMTLWHCDLVETRLLL